MVVADRKPRKEGGEGRVKRRKRWKEHFKNKARLRE